MQKKTFIPTDEPKSFISCIFSVLIGLFVSLLKVFLPMQLQYTITFLWWFFLILSVLFLIYFCIGKLSGKYKNIQSRPWSKQLW